MGAIDAEDGMIMRVAYLGHGGGSQFVHLGNLVFQFSFRW
jgi:hypothetical protein